MLFCYSRIEVLQIVQFLAKAKDTIDTLTLRSGKKYRFLTLKLISKGLYLLFQFQPTISPIVHWNWKSKYNYFDMSFKVNNLCFFPDLRLFFFSIFQSFLGAKLDICSIRRLVGSTYQACLLQNCLKINGTTFFSLKLFPVISSGPQKYKHKIGHN